MAGVVQLPFTPGVHRILEIGGGDTPVFRPNMDMRKLPTVDIVCNLEEKWPIANESFDGVFGKFVIEHVSWRKLYHFVSECNRILVPGGLAYMVGPNTLEQCKEIASRGRITLDESSMLFGGQDEPGWNEHKSAFSPEYATGIFTNCGFSTVEILPWPGSKTDMVIQARKSDRAPNFRTGNRKEWIISKVKNDETILDVGCGPLHYFDGRGFMVTTVDKDPTVTPDIVADADKIPVDGKSFDVVILGDILEHLDNPDSVIKEAIRIARKKLVITVPWEERWSANLNPLHHHQHKVNYTMTSFTELLKQYDYKFVAEEIIVDIFNRSIDPPANEYWDWVGAVVDLRESNSVKLVRSAKKRGLNIGSFTVMVASNEQTEWFNSDILDLNQYAQQNKFTFLQFDATEALPFLDGYFDFIVASHFMEHITRAQGKAFLKECSRVLKPDGIIRIVVPDTAKIAEEYGHLDRGRFQSNFGFNEGVKNAEDPVEAFWNLLTAGHVTAYDGESLQKIMIAAGFFANEQYPGISLSQEIQNDTKDMYPELSVILEGKKVATEPAKLPTTYTIQSGASWSHQTREKLKIGLISTQFFGVPPKGYSGLEMVVWDLACGLSELGHEVTLFAPEGSQAPPNGHVVITGPMLNAVNANWMQSEEEAFNKYILPNLNGLDILHGHNWFGFEYSIKGYSSLKVCHTHHGHMNVQYWMQSKPPFKLNFIGISDFMTKEYEAQGMPSRYVYNGIDLSKYQFKAEKGNRFLYVGRLDSFKRPDFAIECCEKAGVGLDLVGGSFVADQGYLNKVKAMCTVTKNVDLYLDATHEKKIELMQNAKALIFPSKMGEPFGLVAAEAMACGTMVIASPDGAIGEVVENNATGYIVPDNEMVNTIIKVSNNPYFNPGYCRSRVETKFSRVAMARGYEKCYKDILRGIEW
jgi:glycosyltransferase involved in cell wall biosynthesis/predicted SAM-dependent methyltransferase